MLVENYRNCSSTDLLKDRDFLKWILFNRESDTRFWLDAIEEYPALKPKIEEAVTLYNNNIRFNDYKLTRAEISDRLDLLYKLIDKKKKRIRRRITWSVSAISACIVVFIILVQPFSKNDEITQDIEAFVQTMPDDNDLYSSETKLILSDSNTVILNNTESSIEYEANAIKADGKLIHKEGSSSYNRLIIPYGKRSTIMFPDGTKAWVNAGSKLVYPVEFQRGIREVYIDGEMYVEVAEDKKRPFVVKTKQMDISVLGTKFNVTAYDSDKTQNVVLLSGSIRISSDKHYEQVVLMPNQMYSNDDDSYSVEKVYADACVLWTQGLYQFESEELGVIVARLERYYGIVIDCEPTIAELKCSGKLDMKDDLNKLLTELSRALPVKYRQYDNGSYILDERY